MDDVIHSAEDSLDIFQPKTQQNLLVYSTSAEYVLCLWGGGGGGRGRETLPDKTFVCLGPLRFDCVCNVDVYTMAFTARVVEESARAVIMHVLHDRGKAVQCADLHVCA